MPTTYDSAPDDVLDVLREQIARRHHDLLECGAKIGVVMARNESGPAVKHHGTAAFAKVRIVSADKKVHNVNDAEIVIDAGEWDQLLPDQQEALINHELLHLKRKEHSEKKLAALRKDDPDCPAWKLDSHGRPVLGTIPADVTPGDGFAACIEWYGSSAIEFVTAKRFAAFAEQAMAGRASA